MNENRMNSKEYWDHRFQSDWEALHGREQSRFFARLALEHLPAWFFTLARTHGFTFCDWGCAEGDGTDVLAGYFGRDRVCGIDFSEKAVEKARNLYQDVQFLVEDWLTENPPGKSYDVVFSSNTLEHFKRPYEALHCLLNRAEKCVVLLLPYREFDRQPEHDHTFVAENIPYVLDSDFLLAHAQVIDSSEIVPTYWGGHQILLIYAHAAFLREAGFTLSQVRVHDEQEIMTKKRIVELEDSLGQRDQQLTCLIQSLAERDGQISNLIKAMTERDEQVILLHQKIKLFEESLSWRTTKPLRDARQAITLLRRKVTNAILSIRGTHAFSEHRQKKRERYYQKQLNRILKEHKGKPLILFCPIVDWNTPLFQRPQHLAKGLADLGFLFFYCTTNAFDSVDGFEQVHEGCYVTNQFELIDQLATRKIIHIYAADPKCTWEYIQRHKGAGDVLLYEYIDEIHADIAGSEVAETLLDRHTKVLKTDDIICVTSAEKLYRDVARFRTNNLELVTNGVEIEHFSVSRNRADIPLEIKGIVEKNKVIVGYFGALAKWFDYELIIGLARSHPEYEIMLIGWNYDKSLEQYPLSDCPNISVIGPVDYKVLPRYACWFDVSTIPFCVNEVTESTSPIKLFEYMALGHPIVTTDMPECRKYRSVLIGKNHEEFISRIEEALNKSKDEHYLSILRSEAEENTWRSKAKSIADVIKDNMVRNPHWTRTIPYEDALLDAVRTEIVSCYRADKPKQKGYYEGVYSKEERLYWFPVLDWIRGLSSLRRVADIGAAYGTLLLYAIKCHHPDYSLAIDAIGLMSPHFIGRYDITYLNRDIERSAVDDIGTYDLVLFTETLEHLNFHPVQTLSKLRKMLSSNGQIILTTPDAVEWGRVTTYYPSLDAIPRYTGQVVEWIDGHVWQYTREEAESVIRAAGLEVVKFAYARGVGGRHLCFLLRPSSSWDKCNISRAVVEVPQ